MKNIVIKIGGSLLFTKDNQINSGKIIEFSNIVKNKGNYNSIVVVCGGGIIARKYIKTARLFNKSEAFSDILGIDFSRINSKLIIASLGTHAYPNVPNSIEELSIAILFDKIVVIGGLQPGQSTTSVAFEVAEYINADELVILTDVQGIFDRDPKVFHDAKLFKHLTYDQLQNLILTHSGNKQTAAGEYRIFDLVSLHILKRSKIKVYVLSGLELTEFKKLWNGDSNILGTIITE